jgi:ApaG protein
MSNIVTRGIRVQVASQYLPERSSPAEDQYFFTYRVRISNEGSERTRLVTREWIITDSNGDVQRVTGAGVVGEQPLLGPGDAFEYSSFCPLKTAVGSMHGSYQMETEGGDTFDAMIGPFTLAVPNAVN